MLGLVLCMFAGCADNISKPLSESTNSSKTDVAKTATKPLAVSDAQVISMRGIMDKITNGKIVKLDRLLIFLKLKKVIFLLFF